MAALRRATRALRHRGPDAERHWRSPQGRVVLGHTLLAITAPDGYQPIASEDGRLHLVHNGQFYDHARIRRALEERGHRFRTHSDSEIALHLYEELGPGCLGHLRGQFALIIWDEEKQLLFAARDRFGIKPLFHARQEDRLYLASEAKALFAAGVARGWDLRGVYHALHACPDERGSLFAGVAQLPPGHFLCASDAGVRIERYWELPARPPRPSRSAEVAVAQIRQKIEEAVRLRMAAAVPVGSLLSGGLDSSAILGVAATCTDARVDAFTVGFRRRSHDESAGAREAAGAVGARHTVVALGDAELADHFAGAVWHAETVMYNSHGVARFLLSRAVRDAGYRAVLAGEGADEGFFGYEFLRKAGGFTGRRLTRALPFLMHLLPRIAWIPAGLAARRHPALAAVSPWLARLALLLPATPSLFTRLARGLEHLHALLSPDFLHQFTGCDLYRDYYRRSVRTADLARREPARRLLHLWLHSLFVNYHLAADRLDMAHGVEVRLPFLDHELFELLNRLPLRLLTGHPREKHLLRQAMRPYISDAVHERVKRPFMAPAAVGAGGPLHEFLQDTLRGEALRSVPFVNRGAVVQMLDRLRPGQTANPLPAADHPALDSLLTMLASVAVLQEGYGL